MDKKVVSITLAKVGFLLLDVQSTERAIKLCAKVALPKLNQLLTGLGERINNDEYDRKTIGQMLQVTIFELQHPINQIKHPT